MNKKFSTFLVGALLAGACFNANAVRVTTQAELNALLSDEGAGQILVLPEGDNKLEFAPGEFAIPGKKYLVVNTPNVVISGEEGTQVKGRFVLAADDITVKDLHIINESLTTAETDAPSYWDWSLYYHKTAISVLANKATIKDNTITCKPSEGANPNALANGIAIYPRGEENAYTISGNTFKSSNISTPGLEWSSTAIQLVEGFTAEPADNGYGQIDGVDAYEGASSNANVDVKSILANNKFENCAIDLADCNVHDWAEGTSTDYEAAQVTPMVDENGDVSAATVRVLGNIINGSSTNSTVVVNAPADEAMDILVQIDGIDEANVAVQCDDVVLLYGDAENPDPSKNAIAVSEEGVQDVKLNMGDYKAYASTATKVDATNLLIVEGYAVRADKDEDGNVSYTLAQYDKLASTGDNRAELYKWTFTTVETQPNQYELRLKDAHGKYLTLGNTYVTVDVTVSKDGDGNYWYGDSKKFPTSFTLKAGAQNVVVAEGETALRAAFNNPVLALNPLFGYTFGVSQIQNSLLQAENLTYRYGEYFMMKITYDKDGDNEKDLTGIFDGKLVPAQSVRYNNGKTTITPAADNAISFMLVNEDNKILVANKDEDARISEGSNNHVYPLELIDAKTYLLDQQEAVADRIYEAMFSFEYVPGTAADDVTSVAKLTVGGHTIGAYLSRRTPILVAADNVNLLGVTIELNASTANFKPESWLNKPVYYTVEVANVNKRHDSYGLVLGLDQDGWGGFVDPANTDITMPAGQWTIAYDSDDSEYRFINRENGRLGLEIAQASLYKIDDTTFANIQSGDTLSIKPVEDFTSADGYRRLTAAELNDSIYHISMNLLDDTYLYLVENHDDKHRIGLDREEATDWRIQLATTEVRDQFNDFVAIVPDTVTIARPISYYANATDKWVTTAKPAAGATNKYYKPETEMKVVVYVLQNNKNQEYLLGQSIDGVVGSSYYVCNDGAATRIALKKIGEEAVALVRVVNYTANYPWHWQSNITIRENATSTEYAAYANGLQISGQKIIGGTTTATGILKDVDIYSVVTNDAFKLISTGAPVYKQLNMGDKIIISRAENNDEVVYEKGEFAGINNIAAYKDINPALFVDTAYVNREGNYKYQYLLGVNMEANEDSTVMTGRYLVNMVDSANVEDDRNVHTNKYEYNGQTKLAFVNGIHKADSLYFLNTAGETTGKTKVGTANANYAKFAFRMLDEAANEFVVETGAETWTWDGSDWVTVVGAGYLRWLNGNLVVTTVLDQAEHFTLEATDATPTANEEVTASEVSVIAQNGAIIVKGAAGKVVTVANILGQTIANQVAASDNVTIAAPAGVAVVTVDGEATKVIVK
ncbi:MAG: DUF6383 domain-containing protein [Parabacteroides sp.]